MSDKIHKEGRRYTYVNPLIADKVRIMAENAISRFSISIPYSTETEKENTLAACQGLINGEREFPLFPRPDEYFCL